MIHIWDRFVRLFHWSLVLTMATAWITGDEIKFIHEPAGYVVAGLISLRIIWVFFGPHYAQFIQFVPTPLKFLSYCRDIIRNREHRYLGHNPAGAVMVIILFFTIGATALTGFLQTTDAFFGDEFIEDLHAFLADGIIVLIGLHVGGVVLASIRHHENLVRAMWNGKKRAPEPGDIV